MTKRIDAGPETVHWGYFEAALPPLITIDSGERVILSTVSANTDQLPPPPFISAIWDRTCSTSTGWEATGAAVGCTGGA